jgi:drug/metabolite transporter (DMT)-like permease
MEIFQFIVLIEVHLYVSKYMAQNGIHPLLAIIWRGQCMILFLVPLAFIEIKLGALAVQWTARKTDLKYPLFVHVIVAGLGWTGNLVFWISGLMYTTTVRASMFASTYPLMLVVYLHFNGVIVSRIEWLGVLAAIIGIVTVTGSTVPDSNETFLPLDRMYGDGLCLLSAVCETLVIVNRQKTRAYVPLMQYTTITTVIVVFITSILWILLNLVDSRRPQIFCLESDCYFGWLSNFWVGKIIFFGLLIGVVCIAGFNYAVRTDGINTFQYLEYVQNFRLIFRNISYNSCNTYRRWFSQQ